MEYAVTSPTSTSFPTSAQSSFPEKTRVICLIKIFPEMCLQLKMNVIDIHLKKCLQFIFLVENSHMFQYIQVYFQWLFLYFVLQLLCFWT